MSPVSCRDLADFIDDKMNKTVSVFVRLCLYLRQPVATINTMAGLSNCNGLRPDGIMPGPRLKALTKKRFGA